MQRALLLCASLTLFSLSPDRLAHADESIGEHLDDSIDAVEDVAADVSERADEAAHALGKKTSKLTRAAAGTIADGARSLADSTGTLVGRLGQGAWDGAKRMGGAVGTVVGRGTDAASDLLSALRDEARALLMYAADALDANTRALRDSERKAHWDKLRARFSLGDMPSEAVSEELRDHEYRVARLKRVRSLARQAGDDEAAERSETLLESEYARHKRRLEGLRQKAQAKADR